MKIHEKHSELMHYTSAHGLFGIVETNTMWASHVSFLNDSEELTGFFERILPKLILTEIESITGENSSHKFSGHSPEGIARNIAKAYKQAQIQSMDHYALSFCTTGDPDVAKNGLLSQWRGYGHNGGYALVLDAKGIDSLMLRDGQAYNEEGSHWGDVEYDLGNPTAKLEAETQERLDKLRSAVKSFITHGDEAALHSTFADVTLLATVCKHHGFREEREVRIVLTEPTSKFFREMGRNQSKPYRKIHFFERGGTLVPAVHLFECKTNTALPIRRVIVGPHPEKQDRKIAVERLLECRGIEADVLVSDIPFRGSR